MSTKAENQAGYEISSSGDKIYIYEYNNSKILNDDRVEIHNNLNDFSNQNSPIEMGSNNIYMIYLKKDSNAFEIENKILKVL
ncbi:hypothetical protein D3C76_1687150 [compost metagenome]